MSGNNTSTMAVGASNPHETFKELTFKFEPRKSIQLPVACANLPAICYQVCVMGTYTGRYENKNGKAQFLDYIRIGYSFAYLDKNTGEVQTIHTEASLTNKEDGKLHSIIKILQGDGGEVSISDGLEKTCLITVEHDVRKDGTPYAKIGAMKENKDALEVGVDMSDSLLFFNALTDFTPERHSDGFKLLNGKHRWWITERSNEFGAEPFTEAVYEARKAKYEAEQATQQSVVA